MPTVANGNSQTVALYAGQVLAVVAAPGPGRVWRLPDNPGEGVPEPHSYTVAMKEPIAIGPFAAACRFRVDASGGPVVYSVGKASAGTPIDTATPPARSAPPDIEVRSIMALQDKLRLLAAAAKKLPADIEANADALAARIAAVDTRAVNSFGKLGSVMDDAESAVAATEDAVNQLSNGGPALPVTPAVKPVTPAATPTK